MAFRRSKKRDRGFDFRREASDRTPGWDDELQDERGISAHDPSDEGPRLARRDRPLRPLPDQSGGEEHR